MTPEGLVKKRITALLKSYGPELYYFMPVQSGYGSTSLDYICVYKGRPFAVEAKSETGKLSALQSVTIANMHRAGIATFVVSGQASLGALKFWLDLQVTGNE